jgi:hypothetical protein
MEWDIFLISAVLGNFIGGFGIGFLITIVPTVFLLIKNGTDHDFPSISNPIPWKRFFLIVVAYTLPIVVLSSITFGLIDMGDALIKANKDRLVYHYTTPKIAEEKIEPIIEEYINNLGELIKDPKFTIKIENTSDQK